MAEEAGGRQVKGGDDLQLRAGPGALSRAASGLGGGAAGQLAVLGEQLGELGLVQRSAPLGGEVPDQVHRHAVRGEERERVLTGDLEAGAGVQGGEPVQAASYHAPEVTLLAGHQVQGAVAAGGELRVGVPHVVDDRAGHVAKVEAGGAGLGRDGDRLPQQPPRDVPPALVRRGDALAEDERRGPDVVGHDPGVPLPRAGPGEG